MFPDRQTSISTNGLGNSQPSQSKPLEKRVGFLGDSLISDTSAVIKVNQLVKQRILQNHLMVIIVINLVHLCYTFSLMIWPSWYTDVTNNNQQVEYSTSDPLSVKYGLVFNFQGKNKQMNSFSNENNKEQGGISSSILFSMGMCVQIINLVQLVLFFKEYPKPPAWKIIKFKTCRWITLFFYVGAFCYWIIVVFVVQVVSDPSNFNQIDYGFYLAIVDIILFVLIQIYFGFLKRNMRKNDLVSNLLHANRNVLTLEDQEQIQQQLEQQEPNECQD